MDLSEHKQFVITGTGRGIGEHLQGELCVQGHEVLGLTKSLGFDLGNERTWNALEQLFGRQVDVLIHNAAAGGVERKLRYLSGELLEGALDVNFFGPLRLTQKFLRSGQLKMGSVVYAVLTNNLRIHPACYLAYNCSKAALQEMLWTLAAELQPEGIAVGGLILGATDTPAFREAKREDPSMESLATLKARDVARYIIKTIAMIEFPRPQPWIFTYDYE